MEQQLVFSKHKAQCISDHSDDRAPADNIDAITQSRRILKDAVRACIAKKTEGSSYASCDEMLEAFYNVVEGEAQAQITTTRKVTPHVFVMLESQSHGEQNPEDACLPCAVAAFNGQRLEARSGLKAQADSGMILKVMPMSDPKRGAQLVFQAHLGFAREILYGTGGSSTMEAELSQLSCALQLDLKFKGTGSGHASPNKYSVQPKTDLHTQMSEAETAESSILDWNSLENEGRGRFTQAESSVFSAFN